MLEICDEKEKSSLYFSVQDDGIGIEEEKQKLIFSSKTKALMFGGNEISFLIDIQGTGKCIIESLGGHSENTTARQKQETISRWQQDIRNA